MKRLRTIVSLSFAFLVLISSTQFMVAIHHCGGEVKGVALFEKGEACAMEREMPPCHRSLATSCCDDVTVVHEDQDFSLTVTSLDGTVNLPVVMVVETLVLAEVIPVVAPNFSTFYDPPILQIDRPAALQVFLI